MLIRARDNTVLFDFEEWVFGANIALMFSMPTLFEYLQNECPELFAYFSIDMLFTEFQNLHLNFFHPKPFF